MLDQRLRRCASIEPALSQCWLVIGSTTRALCQTRCFCIIAGGARVITCSGELSVVMHRGKCIQSFKRYGIDNSR